MKDNFSKLARHISILGLTALSIIWSQTALSQDCQTSGRTLVETTESETPSRRSNERRYFSILHCSEVVGTAVLRHYAFDELPRDREGEFLAVGTYTAFISRPAGDLNTSAIFFQIGSIFPKSAHGFLVNRSPVARTPGNQAGSVIYFEEYDGTGWLIELNYSELVDMQNLTEIGLAIEDMIGLASLVVQSQP